MRATKKMPKRMPKSISQAWKRATTPAGRRASAMPSGVSAWYSVSSGTVWGRPSVDPHDDRVGDQVVQAAARALEDRQRIRHGEDLACHRNDVGERAEAVAHEQQPPEGGPAAVGT